VNYPPVDLQTALELHRVGRLAEAEAMYRRALAVDPNNPSALHLLGVVLHQNGRSAEGVLFIQRAISLAPHVPAFHNNLGEALRELDRCEDAIASYQRALKLKPAYPEALNNMGGEYGRLARMTEAIACLRQCIMLTPNDPDAHWNLAVALLLTGEWNEGWNEFEWRLRRPESPGRSYPQPLWAGQPLAGKTLLLSWEQGFGDMVQFFRYVAVAKQFGGRVIVDVQPPLVNLLRAQRVADEVYATGDPLPAFDYHAALMSVPRIVKTTLQTVPCDAPYLRADAARSRFWADRLQRDSTKKIGIAWAGRPEHRNDRRRSIPPDLLKPLSAAANATFITVQPRPAHVPPPSGLPVWDLGIELGDFADTAALISQLDLIISVDTSVAHIAGALGKPTWLLLPFSPDWRWLMRREDTPWYPTMRLFRQRKLGDWVEAVGRVLNELRKDLSTNVRE
jgi:Flp pilus assembly protein TadD